MKSAASTDWTKIEKKKPRVGQRCVVLVRGTGHIMDAYYYPHWAGGFCDGRNTGRCVQGVSVWLPYPR